MAEVPEVWWANRADAAAELTNVLDETERGRFTAYRRAEDRDRFLVGCALAKTAVGRLTGQPAARVRLDRACRKCGKPHGKPVTVGAELSVTHSGDLIGVAVCGVPVGLDTEQLNNHRDNDALARSVMSEREHAEYGALPEHERPLGFLVAWTRKEAVTKATGDGLAASFKRVEVSAAQASPRVLAWPYPDDPAAVALFDLPAPVGYAAALAVLGECERFEVHDGSALLSTLRTGDAGDAMIL